MRADLQVSLIGLSKAREFQKAVFRSDMSKERLMYGVDNGGTSPRYVINLLTLVRRRALGKETGGWSYWLLIRYSIYQVVLSRH